MLSTTFHNDPSVEALVEPELQVQGTNTMMTKRAKMKRDAVIPFETSYGTSSGIKHPAWTVLMLS
jgi:hypothetical protein